jgi:hypothetical protein
MNRLFLSFLLPITLAGCGTTETLLAGAGIAGGLVSSLTENKEYNKYADTCKEIINAAEKAATAEAAVLQAVASQPAMGGQVLLYMAMKPKTSAFQQCALALPKSFLSSLAESGNMLNFIATIYSENRAGARATRQLQVSKELGLAQLANNKEMKELEATLLSTLAGQNFQIVNRLAPVPTPGE